MLPDSFVNDMAHMVLANSELDSDEPSLDAASMLFSDLQNVFVCKPGLWMPLAAHSFWVSMIRILVSAKDKLRIEVPGVPSSTGRMSLFVPIMDVICSRTKKHMFRVAAGRKIARMANLLIEWIYAGGNKIGYPMRLEGALGVTIIPIPFRILATGPRPAFILTTNVDMFPKPIHGLCEEWLQLLRGVIVVRHGRIITQGATL